MPRLLGLHCRTTTLNRALVEGPFRNLLSGDVDYESPHDIGNS
jgi:hypothetical protein